MRNDMAYWDPAETLEHLQDYYFPPYITLAHMFHAPDNWIKPEGFHRQYQIQYTYLGVGIYEINGKSYVTKQGDLIIHRPYEVHRLSMVPGEPYSCISIVFHFGSSGFPLEELIDGRHYFGSFEEHPVKEWLQRIVMHYHQPGIVHQMECQQLLVRTIVEAAKQSKSASLTPIQLKNANKLMQVKNFIRNHYQEDIQLGLLEGVSGLSRNYICRLFKAEFGLLPLQYMVWLRFQKAKQLAVTTNMSVTEIARAVGYNDVHSFGKMFKKKTGISLSQFSSSFYMTEGQLGLDDPPSNRHTEDDRVALPPFKEACDRLPCEAPA
ncbi:AraC family transcriptional regulator [Paenibacillus harenae]|uniref:AraC family transcriptional regulator n=1 Tax=Paenibacillus harenae TaxID=306543 RepID=UPI0006857558|nr:AraC family transcriptional regulator [Paenibacillus harenae]